mmetsp:Transcript_4690/g.7706  ORF Transcript_4690/g.7706 Transcript_4690/m.7706 type:complete len:578 (+) Transcript_4690:115-1848(+)
MSRSSKSLTSTQLTLEEALNLIPPGAFQRRLLFTCGLVLFAASAQVQSISFIAVCSCAEWDVGDGGLALLAGISSIGLIGGNVFFGYLTEKYGRRLASIIGIATLASATAFAAIAPSYAWMVIFRFAAGFGAGAYFIAISLLSEFIPASIRGLYTCYLVYFWVAASFYVVGIAWAIDGQYGWRMLAYLVAAPMCMAALLVYLYLPESPRWLLSKNRNEEAEEQVKSVAAVVDEFILPEFTLVADKDDNAIEKGRKPQYWDLVATPEMRAITLPLLLLWFCCGFSVYILYVRRLFDSDYNACEFKYSFIFYVCFGELAGTMYSTTIIESWGRKRTQYVFFIMKGVLFITLGILANSSDGVLLVLSLGSAFARTIAGNAYWAMTPELFSTDLRSYGQSLCYVMFNIGGFLAPFLIYSALPNLAIALVLAIVVFSSALIVYVNFPETAGLRLGLLVEPVRKAVTALRSRISSTGINSSHTSSHYSRSSSTNNTGTAAAAAAAGGGGGDNDDDKDDENYRPNGYVSWLPNLPAVSAYSSSQTGSNNNNTGNNSTRNKTSNSSRSVSLIAAEGGCLDDDAAL